jgi:hypothetical protein
MLQSKAGYIDARPLTASSAKPLATHGRTIHWVKLRSPGVEPAGRLYPQLRTWPCTAQTDALCQKWKRCYWSGSPPQMDEVQTALPSGHATERPEIRRPVFPASTLEITAIWIQRCLRFVSLPPRCPCPGCEMYCAHASNYCAFRRRSPWASLASLESHAP